MGYEIQYTYHPRKEDGPGYDTEVREDKVAKVGKPFDDTPLEKCAAAIMAQLARRDVWVVDVEVNELVKKKISFKESKDGKGIVLKNKKFSLGGTAEMVEEVGEVVPMVQHAPNPMVQATPVAPSVAQNVAQNMQPHELAQAEPPKSNTDDLYSNPNQTSVRRSVDPRSIDRTKKLYQVYFEPEAHTDEARRLKLRFTEDTRYAVHQIIPSPTGKLDNQQIALTDDTGQVVILDEKFFVSAGKGLYGDKQLNFSGNGDGTKRRPKLAYEDQMHSSPPPDLPEEYKNIPIDDGTIPADSLAVPDIRGGK
jgi:hypothetical protein